MKPNISLIGMAGVGKSFLGERLAAVLDYEYVAADQLITVEAQKAGVDKNEVPEDEFLSLEEKVILSRANAEHQVIDTGGSVVYLPKAMKLLGDISCMVYICDTLEHIEKRYTERGKVRLIGLSPSMPFAQLFEERRKLYEQYAHATVDISTHSSPDQSLAEIMAAYEAFK